MYGFVLSWAKVREWGLTKSITFTEREGAPHPGLAQGPAKSKTGPAFSLKYIIDTASSAIATRYSSISK